MKVIATEGKKLLLDWTPPPTCPLFLAKNAQCEGKPCDTSLVTTINTTTVGNLKLEWEKPCTIVRQAL